MLPFRRCLPEECNLLTLQAPHPDRLGGFSWWDIETADVQQQINLAFTQINSFITHALEHYRFINPTRLAFGFSQGAGLLSLLAQREPSRLSAIALLAGFVINAGTPPPAASKLPAIFMAHGTQDPTVSIDQARAGSSLLISLGYNVQMVEDAVAHKVGTQGMRQLKIWAQALISS